MNVLLNRMLSQADPSQAEGLSRFFKTGPGQYGEGDKFLGIKVPVTRSVVKDCWQTTGMPELEKCVTSEFHEVRLAALLTLVEIFKNAGKSKSKNTTGISIDDCVKFYLSHTEYINNWDLVDLSCYPLIGEWLLDKDRTLLYDLARDGKTIWEQRIGIVSTMTFIRQGQLEDTFAIADILFYHPHDLIHKAVGWLLREAGKKDKHALEAYLLGHAPVPNVGKSGRVSSSSSSSSISKEPLANTPELQPLRYQTMPRTMLRYAIEKFPEAERRAYLSGKV